MERSPRLPSAIYAPIPTKITPTPSLFPPFSFPALNDESFPEFCRASQPPRRAKTIEIMAINHGDDIRKSEEVLASACDMGSKENGVERDDHYTDIEIEDKHGNKVDSDYESAKDSLLSHSNEDGKVKRNSRVPKKLLKESGESYLRPTKVSSNRQEQKKLQFKSSINGSKRSQKPNKVAFTLKSFGNKKPEDTTFLSRP